MRDRLRAGARGIDVGGRVGREDGEGAGGEAFGGDVDVGACEGGGGGEEDGLGEGLGGGGELLIGGFLGEEGEEDWGDGDGDGDGESVRGGFLPILPGGWGWSPRIVPLFGLALLHDYLLNI